MENKKILIQDDPWSESFKSKIRATPHYKTVLQWKENIDIPLCQTFYYIWMTETLRDKGTIWEGLINTEQDVIKQCENFRNMFNVAPNWEESKEVVSTQVKSNDKIWFVKNGEVFYFFGPITVRVDELGDFVVSDGNHRLAILLGKDLPISVMICERHEKWQDVNGIIEKLYPVVMYQPFRHPEFFDKKCSRSGVTEVIVNDVVDKFKVSSVLDLGCCHGETLYSLRKKISFGVGVESNEDRLKLVSLLFSKIKFEFSGEDIYNFLMKDEKQYDLVLALAIFHHFMFFNSKEKFLNLLDVICTKTKMLMYELPEPGEPQYAWMYEDFDAHSVIQSYYSSIESFIKDRRKIYLLRK